MAIDPLSLLSSNFIYVINSSLTSLIYIFVLLVLLLMSALFSAAEMALSTVNVFRVRQDQRSKKPIAKNAKKVYIWLKKYPLVLTTILIANNIVNMGASALLTYIFTKTFNLGGYGVIISTLLMATLVIIFGEILPKNIAKNNPEKVAYFIIYPLTWTIFILKPISFIFNKLNETLISKINVDDTERVTATENELLDIIDTIEREGVLEREESSMIKSALRFDETTVNDVMLDKESVIQFYTDTRLGDIIQIVENSKYSRYPVLNRQTNKVVGVLMQRHLVSYLINNRDGVIDFDINKIMVPPRYVSYRRILPYALEKMQRDKNHILIVVDNVKDKNYLGIITMEDVLEEIVGEIYDEYDRLPIGVVEIGHNNFEVKADVKVEDFFDDFLDETRYPNTKFVTMGEWAKRLFKNKLKVGSRVKYDNIEITITESTKDTIIAMEIEELTKQLEED